MPTFADSALLGFGSYLTWVKQPDGGLERPLAGWGGATALVNGSAAVTASRYGVRKFSLSWSHLDANQLKAIRSVLSFPGDRTITYVDRSWVTAGNCLSPLLGRPGLHVDALSPLAFDNNGVRLCSSAALSSGQGDVLVVEGKQPTDGLAHTYTETVTIPAGFDLWVSSAGSGTDRVVRANRTAVGTTPVKIAGDANNTTTATVSLEPNWQPARIGYVRGALAPMGSTARGAIYQEPEGTCALKLVPGSYAETAVVIGARYQVWSVTAELQEVWPWA